MDSEWVIAGASVVTAIGVAFIAWQAFTSARQLELLERQVSADHERSRRQTAIDVLQQWTETLDRAQPSARVVVEGFTIEECKRLKAKKPLSVPKEKFHFLENALQAVLGEDELSIEDDQAVRLNEKHVAQLYFLTLTHLNSLEVALQSWLSGVADSEILERQLEYLIRPEDGHYVLENFRTVLGGEKSYPAIAAFVDKLRDKRKTSQPTQKSGVA